MSVSASRDPADPKGLIREAYRIDGITYEECRSIFMDWALSLPVSHDAPAEIAALLHRYSEGAEAHPMTRVLTEGLAPSDKPRRRGGWRGRRPSPPSSEEETL